MIRSSFVKKYGLLVCFNFNYMKVSEGCAAGPCGPNGGEDLSVRVTFSLYGRLATVARRSDVHTLLELCGMVDKRRSLRDPIFLHPADRFDACHQLFPGWRFRRIR